MIYLALVAWLVILFMCIIKLSVSSTFKIILYVSIAGIIMRILGVM
jgi:hypothetical protein